eukprot:1098330-Pyramimonas_sp.AAC.1
MPYALKRSLLVSTTTVKETVVDHHRPTTTKDDSGGWNGPLPVVKNDPDKVSGHHPSGQSRCATLIAREIGSDNTARRTVLIFVASRSAGRPALTSGLVSTKKGALQMTTAIRLSPKVRLVLKYLIRNFSRIENAVSA